MDDIIEIFSEAAEPVVETLQEWGADVVEHVKEHAPQYFRLLLSAKHNNPDPNSL